MKMSWIVIKQVIAVPRSGPTREQEEATAVRASPQNSSMRSDVSDKRKHGRTEFDVHHELEGYEGGTRKVLNSSILVKYKRRDPRT